MTDCKLVSPDTVTLLLKVLIPVNTLFNGKINPNDLKDFAKAFEKSIIILEKPSDEYKKEIDYVK